MDDNQAGPSGIKRHKVTVKNPKCLTVEEMMQYLYESENDEDLSDPEQDDESSESDRENDDGKCFSGLGICGMIHLVFLIVVDIVPINENIDDTKNTQTEDLIVDWQDDVINMKHFQFTGNNKMLINLPISAEPYDYFRILMDEELLSNIVTETNDYAVNLFLAKGCSERARISLWKNLTNEELLTFIGLLYHMGTINLNRIQDYWKTHRLFNLKCFSEQMGRDRFLGILRCLHFAKNPKPNQQNPDDRLYKIRPVLNYFNNKMRQIYYPGKNLCLDESLVLWRGRLVFRQYIANKRHKYGLKLYMLTEPSGLILNFAVYTGQLDALGGKGHAQKVVMHLLNHYLNKGHSVFMDNYYNSCDLATTLLSNKTYCTGTLRSDRKGTPKEVVGTKLKVGETRAKYCNGIMVGKWRDKRDVTYISTEFVNTMTEVNNKRGIAKVKPLPIDKYNKNMGGIDKQDQMMSYYPSLRKTLFWYKKLAVHVFQLLLFNSYILHQKYSGSKMNFYDFRLAVIEKLLPVLSEESNKRQVAKHIPTKIKTNDTGSRRPRKRCRVCSENKLRKDTVWECQACQDKPGLCNDPCFSLFHKNIV